MCANLKNDVVECNTGEIVSIGYCTMRLLFSSHLYFVKIRYYYYCFHYYHYQHNYLFIVIIISLFSFVIVRCWLKVLVKDFSYFCHF